MIYLELSQASLFLHQALFAIFNPADKKISTLPLSIAYLLVIDPILYYNAGFHPCFANV